MGIILRFIAFFLTIGITNSTSFVSTFVNYKSLSAYDFIGFFLCGVCQILGLQCPSCSCLCGTGDDEGAINAEANKIFGRLVLKDLGLPCDANCDPCYDYSMFRGTGLTCTSEGTIREITFRDQQLTGSLSTYIGNLPSLGALHLRSNFLQGTLPTEIGMLHQLTDLELGFNDLTGTIPSELGNMAQALDFFFIKPQILIEDNLFSGTLPREIGRILRLQQLDVQENQFIDDLRTFSVELEGQENLEQLDFGRNGFYGSLHNQFPSTLTRLAVADNTITSTIPSEFGGLLELTKLKLNVNKLTGEIPSQLANLGSLNDVDVSYNANLSGDLTFVCTLEGTEGFYLSCNNTIGVDCAC